MHDLIIHVRVERIPGHGKMAKTVAPHRPSGVGTSPCCLAAELPSY
eukprot:CAMPEP_0195058044 /NCGR_PEP_ID=MMETSP0448-20130528/6052_1 /TAXON_ID=66468 /ORGANISM="Heterocapsa triquestra, Strain CCMP 448" /LENGTH=45 /DNA_ID= /DNA_START= /DNA_END= /DNA_ORIENTATION=